jgi:hypothetical protein
MNTATNTEGTMNTVTVKAYTNLSRSLVYVRTHKDYLSVEGLEQAVNASVREFEKSGFITEVIR